MCPKKSLKKYCAITKKILDKERSVYRVSSIFCVKERKCCKVTLVYLIFQKKKEIERKNDDEKNNTIKTNSTITKHFVVHVIHTLLERLL